MKGARTLLDFLIQASARGERTALVTITDVIGSSSRAPGTHMAVSETGEFRGSVSGGSVEAAVVGEAKRVIEDGKAEAVRFGPGSKYIDIRLPCGGALDFLVIPEPSMDALREARRRVGARLAVVLDLKRDGSISTIRGASEGETGWHGDRFIVRHEPEM